MRRVVVLIFAILGSFCLFAEDTELKLYRPFGDSVQQAPLVIKEVISGQCWQQSQRIKREDAWRCVAEGKVYDPCFVKQFGSHTQALCPHSPWVGDSVQINLSTPVDNSQHAQLDMSRALPWAIELTTGEKCQAIDEGGIYEGLPIRYQCDSQTVLIGHVQRCKATWSILQHRTEGLSTATVARAWF